MQAIMIKNKMRILLQKSVVEELKANSECGMGDFSLSS